MSRRAPLVAVPAYRLREGRVTRWETGAWAVPDGYVAALRRAGVSPVLVPAGGPGGADGLMEAVSGLVLIGGSDVDPVLYGAEAHPDVYGVDAERDELEISLLRDAMARELPTLGICRGAQVVNVALGGTLSQHLPDDDRLLPHGTPGRGPPVTHDVRLEKGSLVAGACGSAEVRVSSHHHQGLDRLGTGLRPVGWSPDGLVEAVEAEEGWTVAVQWHPEDTAARDRTQQGLFDAFAERARGPG